MSPCHALLTRPACPRISLFSSDGLFADGVRADRHSGANICLLSIEHRESAVEEICRSVTEGVACTWQIRQREGTFIHHTVEVDDLRFYGSALSADIH